MNTIIHGYRDTNPTIDIYVNGVYYHSTNWSRTNKDALSRFKDKYPELANKCKITAKRSK